MARRKSMYSKKRKIKYGRIILLVLLLVVVVAAVSLFFRKSEYTDSINDVLVGNIAEISGTISSISDVDLSVYSNKGIRYTNQHENIKKLNSFDSSKTEDLEKTEDVKTLFESIYKLKKTSLIEDLPLKSDGYYWVDADFVVEDEKLFFADEEEYNFDLFYDRETKTVYAKEMYFTEFSTKNNKQKLQGYEATEEFIKTIEKLAK